MTFSILGRCATTGMVGVAITTSSICVGSRCPHVRPGVGAVATQNVTLPSIGPRVLDRLSGGQPPEQALASVLAGQGVNPDYRQVIVLDKEGRGAQHSGAKTLGTNAVAPGRDCIAAGNLLKSTALPGVMAAAFARSQGHLAERLLTALEAGLYEAGGEMGPVHSAALLVADKQPWPLVDLRVDWDELDPIKALRGLWTAYQPQMTDYVTRALDPASAPAYGVPGDE